SRRSSGKRTPRSESAALVDVYHLLLDRGDPFCSGDDLCRLDGYMGGAPLRPAPDPATPSGSPGHAGTANRSDARRAQRTSRLNQSVNDDKVAVRACEDRHETPGWNTVGPAYV